MRKIVPDQPQQILEHVANEMHGILRQQLQRKRQPWELHQQMLRWNRHCDPRDLQVHRFHDEPKSSKTFKKLIKIEQNCFNHFTASPCPKSWAWAWFICGSVSWCATAAATSSTARWTAASSTVGNDVGDVLRERNWIKFYHCKWIKLSYM